MIAPPAKNSGGKPMPWRNEVANTASMLVGVVHLAVALWALLVAMGLVHATTDSMAALLAISTGASGTARVGNQVAGLDR